MENLSFLEINHVRERKTSSNSFVQYNMVSNMSFVARVPEQTGVRDITDEMIAGRFVFKPVYTLFFLYDYMEDNESRDFISFYGGKLHRITSANISIVTYFTTKMVENWSNIPYRETVQGNEVRDYNRIMNKIRAIQSEYNVSCLPALVVVKNDTNDYDNYCVVYLDDLEKDSIYNAVVDIIDKINNNYEADFKVIKELIKGPGEDDYQEDGKTSGSDFIQSLAKQEGISLNDLAKEMKISVRAFYDKREKVKNRRLTRDEILYIGLRFGITTTKLDELLKDYGHQELGYSDRDAVIRKALIRGISLYEVENEVGKIIQAKENTKK